MLIDQWATAQGMLDTFDGYSAVKIENMPMEQYARLSHRPVPAEAATAALDAKYQASAAQVPQQPQQPVQEAQQPVQDITDEQFLAWRASRVGGGENIGIMNSNSGTDAWVAAARAKVGRTQYGQQNTQDAARIDASKYLDNGGQQIAGRAHFYK